MDDSNNQQAEIVLYQADGRNVPVQVSYWGDTFWMPQSGMAELFDTSQQNVSLHLKNIYETGELQEESTHKDFLSVRQEGSRNVRRTVAFYNLDAIIAVGYRVNSKQATQFRIWATGVLREYVIKGFALNDDMLKNGRPFGQDYFHELLQRVRDIRASEKRFYVQICEVFQEICTDYDKDAPIVRTFYKNVQNRFHYAVTQHTAPEIIHERADAGKPHMGLTTWKDAPDGRIHSSDVTIAKNYLSEDEINKLNRLSSGFLDMIESRIENMQTTTMSECLQLVNTYIQLTGGPLMPDIGKVTRKQADVKPGPNSHDTTSQAPTNCPTSRSSPEDWTRNDRPAVVAAHELRADAHGPVHCRTRPARGQRPPARQARRPILPRHEHGAHRPAHHLHAQTLRPRPRARPLATRRRHQQRLPRRQTRAALPT